MRISLQLGLISGTALALSMIAAQSASAQMYSNSPGFYMSLEGRTLHSADNRTELSSPSVTNNDGADFSNKTRDDEKDRGGKATLGYRLDNNWDVGVSGSFFKGQR